MSERAPIQNKQILDKVSEALEEVKGVSAQVGKMSNDISSIQTELKLRPSLDKSEHDKIQLELTHHKEEIDALKANQRLIIVAIVLAVVAAVLKIVII